ncbi:nucleotide sugar dehydrogenase [Macrococcoides canis]|uniref:nucleotide sugar dehydrogenase n=1 Tax=Macrococcoides canis TaxID=1855823 RepID=UPI0020B6AC47|nr:nucleotide sugar dehydrogenase [Macrococcus canis]UTH00858.1 nucleotide sugar dehydrogenase [Macrococcus canis]UTH03222.1 nucleotide sugar dehydrogenase [Macrococcus canis]
MDNFLKEEYDIAVIGLGYVGLPLAYELSKVFNVTGFDVNTKKVDLYKSGIDITNEIGNENLSKSKINFSSSKEDLKKCNVFIVCVPTPINNDKTPNFTPIIKSTETITEVMERKSIIIYESTVYPGTTEEICLPIIESNKSNIFNETFALGYSPERINPGDKVNTIRNIKKIVSGSNEKALNDIKNVYSKVVDAGLHIAPNIKVAEAAKVIENAQRDVNIAFMNEISKVFNMMEIDTNEVLEAASTKWNFMKFKPGLVGGHCISVDPYYFIYKAEQLGYYSELLSSARRVNESMPKHIVYNITRELIKNKLDINTVKVLVYGLTFKENCNDTRNSKVLDVLNEMKFMNISFDIYDPYLEKGEQFGDYTVEDQFEIDKYDCVIIAVPHDEIKNYFKNIDANRLNNILIIDLKSDVFSKNEFNSWSL